MAVLPLVLLGLVLLVGPNATNPIQKDTETPVYRLNKNYKPSSYVININVPDNFEKKHDGENDRPFQGSVTIQVSKTKEATSNILQLHMDKYMDNKEKLTIEIDGDKVEYRYDSKTEILEIDVDQIVEDTFELSISYEGHIYDTMFGFYLSDYRDNGETKYIVTTQFQPTYARHAFPCWDEPEFKAEYTISLEIPGKYNAISNQPANLPLHDDDNADDGNDDDNEETTPARKKITFQKTPPMSTYLLAFVVSEFESKDVKGKENEMKVWAPPTLIANAAYASEISWDLIRNQGDMFGIPYFPRMEINHLDTVAIPDFAAGAMENWGLMTFRESALLLDGNEPTMEEKQHVISLLAHEFAHSWFGDWVTMHWWSDAWLNEGFAQYFEAHSPAKIGSMQHFELEKQFVLREVQCVLETDGNKGALPLSSNEDDVNTEDEIHSMFGTITYSKGAAIVRMMEKLVGKEVFMDNLKKYLEAARKPGKGMMATPDDLFASFQDIQKLSFKTIMDGWIKQSGHPVISVSLSGKDVIVNQKQFLYHEATKEEAKSWHVPIFAKKLKISKPVDETIPLTILKPGGKDLKVVELPEDYAIFINPENMGFYRVQYDTELLKRISTLLTSNPTKVDSLTRAQLINDVLNLARANEMDYSDAFGLLDYMEKETEYYPWKAAFTAFSYLRKRLVGDSLRTDVTSTMSSLAKKFFEAHPSFEIPADEKNAIRIYTKMLALEWACEIGEEKCVEEATKLFNSAVVPPVDTEQTDPIKLNANFNSIVYCAGLRHSEETQAEAKWDKMWAKYEAETTAAKKVTILTALGCTKNEKILNKYLKWSLDNTKIRKQDALTAFTAVLTGNPEGVQVALRFLTEDGNLANIKASYGTEGALSSAILELADRLTEESQVDLFEEFLDTHKDELFDAVGVAKNAITSARTNIDWASSAKLKLKKHLRGSASSLVATSFLGLILVSLVSRLL